MRIISYSFLWVFTHFDGPLTFFLFGLFLFVHPSHLLSSQKMMTPMAPDAYYVPKVLGIISRNNSVIREPHRAAVPIFDAQQTGAAALQGA